MSTQIPWIQPLGLKAADVDDWKLEIKPGDNLTFWALEKGRLAWPQYKDWAMEHYQLASIHEDYFLQPAPLEFWKLIQSVANWSPSLLPLEEWDGVIFIGCVEPPPADLAWSFPVQFVLVSPISLKTQWQKYHQAPQAIEIHISAEAPPPLTITPYAQTPAVVDMSDLALTLNAEPEVELSAQYDADGVAVEEAPQAPEGLSFNLGEMKKVELSFDLEATTGPSTPEEFVNQMSTSAAMPPAPPSSVDEPSVPDLNDLNTFAGQLPVLESESPAETVLELNIDSTTRSAEHSLMKDIPTPVPVAPSAPHPMEAVSSEDQALIWTFNEMKKFFDQSMYLKFDGTEFHAAKWSEGWQPKAGAETTPIKIDTPSMFRIAVRTQHSYHGKIMVTPAHDAFFKNWSQTGIPEMANAIPLMINGKVVGLILSVGPETSAEAQALEHAEKIVGRLQQKLTQLNSNQAA